MTGATPSDARTQPRHELHNLSGEGVTPPLKVVLIMTDQHRWNSFGCMGGPWHTGILGMGAGNRNARTCPTLCPLSTHGYHTLGGKMHFWPQHSLQGFHRTVLDEARRRLDEFISDYQRWFERNAHPDSDTYEHGLDSNSWMARPSTVPEPLHPTNSTAVESIRALQTRDPSRPFFRPLGRHRGPLAHRPGGGVGSRPA